MKMELAVYTAQEGYSWQPGTALTADDLLQFKKAMGKFPSPDSMDFPFGGVFLLDNRVVFYRYHVAKKIDFRGRDALYCVLGAVSREEAAKIDPAALFARPEFAGPMKPFPVSLDVPEAEADAVPKWLKNLNTMTLDVRITGTADSPSYAVVQNPVEVPEPPPEKPIVEGPNPVVPPGGPKPHAPAPDPVLPQKTVGPVKGSHPVDVLGGGARPARPQTPRWMVWGVASSALIAVLLAAVLLLFWLRKHQDTSSQTGGTKSSKPVVTETSGSNAVKVVIHQTNTTDRLKPTALADAVQLETNSVASATNVLTAATNSAPAVKAATAPVAEKKVKAAPPQPSPKAPANGQKKNPTSQTGNSAAAKKPNSPRKQPPKAKQ